MELIVPKSFYKLVFNVEEVFGIDLFFIFEEDFNETLVALMEVLLVSGGVTGIDESSVLLLLADECLLPEIGELIREESFVHSVSFGLSFLSKDIQDFDLRKLKDGEEEHELREIDLAVFVDVSKRDDLWRALEVFLEFLLFRIWVEAEGGEGVEEVLISHEYLVFFLKCCKSLKDFLRGSEKSDFVLVIPSNFLCSGKLLLAHGNMGAGEGEREKGHGV